jgi:hypothetical protein
VECADSKHQVIHFISSFVLVEGFSALQPCLFIKSLAFGLIGFPNLGLQRLSLSDVPATAANMRAV